MSPERTAPLSPRRRSPVGWPVAELRDGVA